MLIGFSIGTTAAVDLASKKPKNLMGLVLMAPFTSGIRLLLNKPRKEETSCLDCFTRYHIFLTYQFIYIINVSVMIRLKMLMYQSLLSMELMIKLFLSLMVKFYMNVLNTKWILSSWKVALMSASSIALILLFIGLYATLFLNALLNDVYLKVLLLQKVDI